MGQVIALFAIAFLTSLVLAGTLTWMVRELALAQGWATPPTSSRHIHRRPIPRLGGIAIFVTFATVSTLGMIGSTQAGISSVLHTREILTILVPGCVLFLVGLVDDFFDLRPTVKLSFQILAGLSLYAAGLKAVEVELMYKDLSLGPVIGLVTTVLWVIAVSNGINIIDGVDGLAAGSALFSLVTMLSLSVISAHYSIAFLSIVLAGTLVGFLKFNFSPATIFLGDSGSLFIGFVLSAMALACKSQTTSIAVAVAIPVVALGFPLVETGVSILRRFISGRRIFEADRAHIHHRLLELGLTQRQVVAVLYAFSAVCALVSMMLLYPEPFTTAIILTLLALLVVAGLRRLNYSEFKEFKRIFYRMIEQKHAIANNVALRSAGVKLEGAADFDEIYRALTQAVGPAGVKSFELVIAAVVPRPGGTVSSIAKSLFWSCKDGTPEAHTGDEWSFGVNLLGNKLGPLGTFRISGSTTSKILFDLNVLLVDIQPHLSTAIERAIAVDSSRFRRIGKNDRNSSKRPSVNPPTAIVQ